MNYLAHALLAGPDADYRLGGLLGDFVKGPLDRASANLSEKVLAGIVLHRQIDSFAEAHVAFRTSRARVSAERRRYGGIMIDLFYDHFLAVHWARFSEQPLPSFTADVYALLAGSADLLPKKLAEILPFMRRDDWLASYRKRSAVSLALDRMSVHRLKRANTLGGSGAELTAAYGDFERDFLDFFPEALAFADRMRENAPTSNAAPM